MNQPKHDPLSALRNSEFVYFLSFRFLLTFAITMQALAVQWQIYSLTHDPLALGLIGLAEAIPFVATSLVSGHFADTRDRKTIVVWFSVLYILCSALLWFFSSSVNHVVSSQITFPFYAVIFLTGISRGFIASALAPLMMQIIGREKLSNATAWNSNVWHAAAVSGPVAGGFLVGWMGYSNTYILITVCLILSFIIFQFIKRKPKPEVNKTESLSQSLKAGIRFVFANEFLLGALSLDLFAVLFGGAVALLPMFADTQLHVGAIGLGILRAAPFTGSIIMGTWLAFQPPMKKAGRNLFICVAGFGLCMIAFAFSHNFYLSIFILMLSGMFDNVSVIIRHTIVQLMTPDHMRGRVSAVNNIFIGSSNEIGAFESGTAARLMGLVPSVVFGGIMTIMVVGFTAWRAPGLKKLNMQKLIEKGS